MDHKKRIVYFTVGLLAGFALLIGFTRIIWHGKYYPGATVAGVELGSLSREDGKTKLEEAVQNYTLKLTYNGAQWTLPTDFYQVNIEDSANQAYRMGRRLKISDYITFAMGRPVEFPLLFKMDESKVDQWMDSEITQAVEITPLYARVEIGKKGEIKIINGSDGVILDREKLKQEIKGNLGALQTSAAEVPLRTVERQMNDQELAELQHKAESLLGKTLEIVQDDEKITLKQDKLISWLTDEGAIKTYVQSLATLWKRDPQDAKFSFADGKVKEFAPAKDGIEVRTEETTAKISEAYQKLLSDSKSEKVDVAVNRIAPKITNEKVNNLGIVERIGRGESYYAHSIANRIYNVGLASSRVNGALVAPGEEFSFNRYVGEISAATGYKTAYVISGGRTVLGDGGGVCQVSTTLFRAVMDAGLPITERWAHAYRVGYYEQNSLPGIDATVYSPSKDFKFVNDTPGHILVQVINDPKNLHLIFEIYGTKDGRVATVSKPVVSGQSPPPPDIYEEDPNLPAGSVKQVDWAAWGAKASFDYKVTKADGTPLFAKTYVSNYKPWANVFIKGTAGAAVAAQ